MPVDHTSIPVPSSQFKEVVEWYLAALAPLGYKKIMDYGVAVGLGDPTPDFWLGSQDVSAGDAKVLPVHTAFHAKSELLFCVGEGRIGC